MHFNGFCERKLKFLNLPSLANREILVKFKNLQESVERLYTQISLRINSMFFCYVQTIIK